MKNIYDLVVVGSGVLGTFHAYHALQQGYSVLLIEKDNHPRSATVRNFGQIVPSGMKASWFEYSRRSLEIYRSIQQEYDLSVKQNGSIYIASDDEELQLLHELKASFDERDYFCQLINKQQCLDRWPSLRPSYVREGLYFPEELSVDPVLMIHRLIEYLQRKFDKLTYRPGMPVSRLEQEADHTKLFITDGSTFAGKKILVCSGAEFRLLLPQIFRKSKLEVSKLQMMRTPPLPGISLPGNILTGLTIRRYESFTECPSFRSLSIPEHYAELKQWGIHILFKQADDGSIILGDSHEYASASEKDALDYEINHHINELIIRESERIVDITFDKISHSWSGIYSQHPEDIFYQKINNDVHVLTGIGGKGMSSSAGYAEHKIDEIMEY